MEKLIENLIKQLRLLDGAKLLFEANSQPELQDLISELITSRLSSIGTTGSGLKLRTDTAYLKNNVAYAPLTELIKGLKTHVNLRMSGAFHESIEAIPKQNGDIEVIADFEKGNQHIYENFENQFYNEKEFENDVLCLNEIEIEKYQESALYEITLIVKNALKDVPL